MEDASKRILDARADESGKDEIISSVSAVSTGEVNPILEDARKSAERPKA